MRVKIRIEAFQRINSPMVVSWGLAEPARNNKSAARMTPAISAQWGVGL